MRFTGGTYMVAANRAGAAISTGMLFWLLASATAIAQQPEQWPRFELTPFAGYQSGEEFTDQTTGTRLKLESAPSAGLILDMNVAPDTQLEFYYSRAESSLSPEGGGPVPTDIKVEYLHVGAIYAFSRDRVRPFFGGTAGATRLSPDASGLNSDTNFSVGLTGGVKLFLTKHVGLRLEARVFATQVDSESAAFCTNGTCRIFYDGDFLWQYTANAGIVIGF